MNEEQLLDWQWNNVEGDTLKQMEILKIALCQKYQDNYTDIDTMCSKVGLTPFQANEVRQWKYHNKPLEYYYFCLLYDYLVYEERERFLKSLYIYYKQNS